MLSSQTISTLHLPGGYLAEDVLVEITHSVTPFDPGCTSGPPERCYPPEGGEVELEFASLLQDTAFYCPDSQAPDITLPAGSAVGDFLATIPANQPTLSHLEDQLYQEASQAGDYDGPDEPNSYSWDKD